MPIWRWFLIFQCQPVLNAQMTDKKPEPTPPRPPLRLPPNCRDVTAEKTGTVIRVVGATAAKATKPR
jgi:hypothetical protein